MPQTNGPVHFFEASVCEGLEAVTQNELHMRLGGQELQINVVDAETLRAAKSDPLAYPNLIVRVAGYSDYFCDLSVALQEEIIARTEQTGF